jgi:hypothetical protein
LALGRKFRLREQGTWNEGPVIPIEEFDHIRALSPELIASIKSLETLRTGVAQDSDFKPSTEQANRSRSTIAGEDFACFQEQSRRLAIVKLCAEEVDFCEPLWLELLAALMGCGLRIPNSQRGSPGTTRSPLCFSSESLFYPFSIGPKLVVADSDQALLAQLDRARDF